VGDSLEGLAESQVDINLDLRTPKLTFGVIGASPMHDWWKSFVPRFGEIAWSMGKESEENRKLERLLHQKRVDVLLVEAGRIGSHSAIWREEVCKVIISMDGWSPPRGSGASYENGFDMILWGE
jgi:hypothetical protein